MSMASKWHPCAQPRTVLLLFLPMLVLVSKAEPRKPDAHQNPKAKRKVPALIVFGDSTVDPGNNNHISTSLKSDFAPYGRDFMSKKPTGRFTNGKLVTDFLAESLGIKDSIPAYLDPGLTEKDLLTGVSFASAGTGFDNRTARTFSVISLSKEMEYFKEYLQKLNTMAGAEKAQQTIGEAIFVVSMGSNDFLENYYVNPYSRLVYNVPSFQNHLLQIAYSLLEEIYNHGARRITIAGLPPLGCLPIERTLSFRIFNRGRTCIDSLNKHAVSYNEKLQRMIEWMKPKFPDLKIAYADVFTPLMDMAKNPAKYGIEETSRACCGTGLVEFGLSCNNRTPFTCPDASKYMFWDAFHPTQRAYKAVADELLINCIPKVL